MEALELMIRKLRLSSRLNGEDIEALKALPIHMKELPARTHIVREGDRPSHSCVLVKGLVGRSKVAHSGKRQILSFHIPGDIPDLESLLLEVVDYDLITLSPATLALVNHSDLKQMVNRYPAIASAFWRDTLINSAVYREWIVNVAVRPAPARMAHLVAELGHRMQAIGLRVENEFEFPITQQDLAEALGISSVHVNRVLQTFRSEGMMDMRGSKISLKNLPGLIEMSGFNPLYLHEEPLNPFWQRTNLSRG